MARIVLPHLFSGPSLSAPNCYNVLCFDSPILIARAITCLFVTLNLGEGWMFLVLELLVGRKERAVEYQVCLFV